MLLCVATLAGCGARAEVAKDKILKRIDEALGELDVKRKEVELKKKELNSRLDDLRARRIKTEVTLESVNKQQELAEAAIEDLKGRLAKVQDLIKEAEASENGSIERDGKTYTAEQIEATGKRVIDEYKSEEARIQNRQTRIAALQQAYDFLVKQEDTARGLMEQLDQKISEIDAKKVAVDAVKEASTLSGDKMSINDSLADLQKEIDDLAIDVETALRFEQGKLADIESTTSAADELLTEPASLESLGSEIDALLKGSGGRE